MNRKDWQIITTELKRQIEIAQEHTPKKLEKIKQNTHPIPAYHLGRKDALENILSFITSRWWY